MASISIFITEINESQYHILVNNTHKKDTKYSTWEMNISLILGNGINENEYSL